jgi:hypothetical protein
MQGVLEQGDIKRNIEKYVALLFDEGKQANHWCAD